MTSNIAAILDAISDANDALKRVPELEREIESLRTDITHKDTTIATQRDSIRIGDDMIESLRADIVALKKELDEARFRELVALEDAEKANASLRSIVALAGGVVEPAPVEVTTEAPKPEPVAEEPKPVEQPSPATTPTQVYEPYLNKPYTEKPWYVSDKDWTLGGGQPAPTYPTPTDDNYWKNY